MFSFLLVIFLFILQREELEAALAEERASSQREQARLTSEVIFNFYLFLTF